MTQTATTDIPTTHITILGPEDGLTVGPPDPKMPIPTIHFKVSGDHGVGFSLIEFEVPAGFAPPPNLHRHTRESGVIYVLEGELEYTAERGEPTAAGPGTVVVLPRGGWFRWRNPHRTRARMLCMFSPAGFEQYFAEVAEALTAADFDPAALGAVIPPLRAKYGDQDYDARAQQN